MPDPKLTSLWPSDWKPQHLAAMPSCDLSEPFDAMCARLDHYLNSLRTAIAQNEFIDLSLGELLVGAIKHLGPEDRLLDPVEKGWVRMAVAYLVAIDDATNDLTTIDGLDDDAEVVLGLLDALKRHDLAHPIRLHLHR